MTCVVGLVNKGVVYLGADSAGVEGWHIQHRADPKVFRNGLFAMGFTDSFRMGNLLRYAFQPPPYKGNDPCKYMVLDFVNALRECFKQGGFARKKDETESAGAFLVGFKGKLFEIDSDYQVGESLDDYNAIGVGQEAALGALHALAEMEEIAPQDRLRAALEAAVYVNMGVCEPFNFVSTERMKK